MAAKTFISKVLDNNIFTCLSLASSGLIDVLFGIPPTDSPLTNDPMASGPLVSSSLSRTPLTNEVPIDKVQTE